jgi:hypothetical protein
VELLIATALGAALLAGLATTAGVFTEQMAYVGSEADAQREVVRALNEMLDGSRAAWTATSPTPERLVLEDPYGNDTTYELVSGSLRVTRPSGAAGDLLASVSSFQVSTATTRRLRDAAPLVQAGTVSAVAAPGGAPRFVSLGDQPGMDGVAVALALPVPSQAPDSVDVLPDVDEQLLQATLGTLQLPLSYVDSSAHAFCHLHATGPPHDPSHPGGLLSIELFEARAPGDARPWGPSLGSVGFPTTSLPLNGFQWWDTVGNEVATPPNGVAWGWWSSRSHIVPQFFTTTPLVTLDLSGLGAVVEAGKAYVLVLRVTGWDTVTLGMEDLTAAPLSGLALEATTGAGFVDQALALPCTLIGDGTYTQTAESWAVSRVSLSLVMDDGWELSGSAAVAGQSAAPDPWMGGAPGEFPSLVQAGQ